MLRPGKFFQLAKAAFDEVTLCVEMFVEGVFRRAGRLSGITAWAVHVHGKSSVKLSPTRAPQATIPAELPHGSHFAIHCDYPTSIAAATAGNTSRALIVNYNVRGVSRNRGAPRQDCIETPAKSEVVRSTRSNLPETRELQSTATILITTGDPRRCDRHWCRSLFDLPMSRLAVR